MTERKRVREKKNHVKTHTEQSHLALINVNENTSRASKRVEENSIYISEINREQTASNKIANGKSQSKTSEIIQIKGMRMTKKKNQRQ